MLEEAATAAKGIIWKDGIYESDLVEFPQQVEIRARVFGANIDSTKGAGWPDGQGDAGISASRITECRKSGSRSKKLERWVCGREAFATDSAPAF